MDKGELILTARTLAANEMNLVKNDCKYYARHDFRMQWAYNSMHLEPGGSLDTWELNALQL